MLWTAIKTFVTLFVIVGMSHIAKEVRQQAGCWPWTDKNSPFSEKVLLTMMDMIIVGCWVGCIVGLWMIP